MKTVKFFISNLIVLSFILTFTACSEDEILPDPANESIDIESVDFASQLPSQTNLDAKQIGDFHNIAVDLYLNNFGGKRQTVKEIEQSVIKVLSDNYPDLMADFKMPTEYNSLGSVYNSYSINEFQLARIMDDGFAEILRNRDVSPNFSRFITNLTQSNASVQEKVADLQAFRSSSNDETELLNVYREVLLASNDLWSRRWSNSRISCSSGVIAADAVGAGLGLFGGPVWSIIQGAVVSIAVNEDCEDEEKE